MVASKAAYYGSLLANPTVKPALGFLPAIAPSNPAVFYRTNQPRHGLYDSAGDAGHAALASGVMTSVPIWLARGDLVTNLTFISGATAANTPTNYWMALYSTAGTPALLGQSADQTNTAWAANTVKTLALAVPYRVPISGVYWAALMVAATTPPSLIGAIAAKPVVAGERNLSQSSGAGLTAVAPGTIAAPTVKTFAPLVVVT
jgi:hypothetical protein